ncbi:MAG: polysaccharide biosynthesis protein [Planctomycetes bacterium]|nr:polysaccharide biosynthesis protein [Planctomycetota bacterium]
MADSNINTEVEGQDPSEIPTPFSLLLTFRKPLIVLAHIFIFAVSLMLAFLLASNMQFRSSWFVEQYPTLLVFFILVKLIVFGLFKQYRGWWRYVGISDLIGIASSSLVSTLIIVSSWFIMLNTTSIRRELQNLTEVSQSVFMLDMFATILLLAGLRMVIRLYYEEFRTVESGRLKRFLIIGAGNAGEALLREIHRMPVAEYEAIGFIDDDPAKKGINIHGMPLLGTVEQLPKICKDRNIEEIAIAMPSATHQQLRRVIQICEGTKIRFRTVPSITDIASGKFSVSQIRDVDISDLLGREVVNLDLQQIEAFLKDKTILVTGAGGSIGSEMCRQVCSFEPKLLLLVEQAENPLFYVERELRKKFPQINMKAVICNITDKTRVEEVFEKYKPEVVIHAAAHKHVPLMELNPGEAVKNNIIGTRTIADAAGCYDSTNFVMISTDKAVNPTSIMGASKRVAETYIQDLNKTSNTHFVTVRFGNVLGSDGSVVPIFKKQIAEGGPVTVTHPEMQRYFMTIPEASQLVLQAATMGKGGEIFLLDMGEPVKIVDLARELITLSGFIPGEDIEVAFTGLRPGEKLFEELSIKGEDMQPTRHAKIGIWKNIPMDRDKLYTGIDELVAVAKTQDHEKIVQKIKQLVPEYIDSKKTDITNE